MATRLHRIKGDQFFDNNGAPLAGGKLRYDEAGTTNLQDTFSDAAGATPNTNPLILDASGRLQQSVFFGDSASYSDYKETLTNAADVTVTNWPVDDLPAAEPAATAAAFAPPLFPWTQVSSGDSPVALTPSDAGKAYEADTTSGNIEFDLPSAASVGNGKGFVFKKTAAANSMIIDQAGSETIDNSATALTFTHLNALVGVFSNGAEWYVVDGYKEYPADSKFQAVGGTEGGRLILAQAPSGGTLAGDAILDIVGNTFRIWEAGGGFRGGFFDIGECEDVIATDLAAGRLVAIIEDNKAQNTAGGTFTSGADRTRDLNTLVYNRDALVSLGSNQFTLPAGTWEIEWSAPAGRVALHQSFLYDVTNAAEIKRGMPVFGSTADPNITTLSNGSVRVSQADSVAYEIRHRSSGTFGTSGFGTAANFGTEVYTRVIIRKG